MQNTNNLILINYKNLKKKSHILNKNHYTTKITTHSTLLKIRKKNDHK